MTGIAKGTLTGFQAHHARQYGAGNLSANSFHQFAFHFFQRRYQHITG
jgi:hypothetical protein